MSDDEDTSSRYQVLLDTLNKAVKTGPWAKSMFLGAVGKKLTKFRDELAAELDKVDETTTKTNAAVSLGASTSKKLPEGVIEIYVALYCANGGELRNWESILSSLSTTVISRPIYRSEADVKALISSRPHKQNEAYCLVRIKEANIAKPFTGKNPQDKLGHELLVLKRAAISSDNIVSFRHQHSEYSWNDGRLVAH